MQPRRSSERPSRSTCNDETEFTSLCFEHVKAVDLHHTYAPCNTRTRINMHIHTAASQQRGNSCQTSSFGRWWRLGPADGRMRTHRLPEDRVPAVELLAVAEGDVKLGRLGVRQREHARVEVRHLPVGLLVDAREDELLAQVGALDLARAVACEAPVGATREKS